MTEDILLNIAIVIVSLLIGGTLSLKIKQPPIIGYILTGVLLGASCLGVMSPHDHISLMAELGIILLLFIVGMELNLETFKKYWLISTLCTVIQIIVALTVTLISAYVANLSIGLSLLFGFIISVSSTAVVVKILEVSNETQTTNGQISIGVLIAQDLAVIPMLFILKNYGQSAISVGTVLKLIGAMVLIAVIIMRVNHKKVLYIPFAKTLADDEEMTPIASIAFCIACAATSSFFGLSMAYGAFLAGILLGNTRERSEIISATKPIQSVLLMVFFLSIGLMVDLSFIKDNILILLKLLVVVTIGKIFVNVIILRSLRVSFKKACFISVVLSQLGEFSFVMAEFARHSNIINNYGQQLIISLTVLSLAISPFMVFITRYLQSLIMYEKNNA